MSLKGELMAAHVDAMLEKNHIVRAHPGQKFGRAASVKFRDVKTEVSYAEAMFKIGYELHRPERLWKIERVLRAWSWALQTAPTDFVGNAFIRTMRRHIRQQRSASTGDKLREEYEALFDLLAGPEETPEDLALRGLRKLLD